MRQHPGVRGAARAGASGGGEPAARISNRGAHHGHGGALAQHARAQHALLRALELILAQLVRLGLATRAHALVLGGELDMGGCGAGSPGRLWGVSRKKRVGGLRGGARRAKAITLALLRVLG